MDLVGGERSAGEDGELVCGERSVREGGISSEESVPRERASTSSAESVCAPRTRGGSRNQWGRPFHARGRPRSLTNDEVIPFLKQFC
jgi:hypothetical protein